MDLTEKVLKALKSSANPLKSAEISEMSGVDKKDVDKVLKKLKTDGKITSPKMCFYQIK